MLTFGESRDGGSRNFLAYGVIHAMTAGATSDNQEQNCAWVDRRNYRSVDVYVPFTATLAQGATLTFAGNLQDSPDATNGIADFTVGGASVTATVVATGPSGGGTVTGVAYLGRWDLTMADRYVRAQVTGNLSAANTDTATFAVIYSFNGPLEVPVQTPLNA